MAYYSGLSSDDLMQQQMLLQNLWGSASAPTVPQGYGAVPGYSSTYGTQFQSNQPGQMQQMMTDKLAGGNGSPFTSGYNNVTNAANKASSGGGGGIGNMISGASSLLGGLFGSGSGGALSGILDVAGTSAGADAAVEAGAAVGSAAEGAGVLEEVLPWLMMFM